jgi:hypothetical protein
VQGTQGTAIQGIQGSAGTAQGATGAQGITGSQGSTGGTEFVFQNVGFNYSVDGFVDTTYPTLTVVRGQLYYFNLTNVTSSHPLALRLTSGNTTSAVPGTTGNSPDSGAFGNGTSTTIVTYRVPFDAPSLIYYQCVIHPSMIGTINIVDQAGTQGTTGAQGISGTNSGQGATGFQGVQGATGTQGTQGTTGSQGLAGPGTSINATASTDNTDFYIVGVSAAGGGQTATVSTTLPIKYNPSTGLLTASTFSGSLSGTTAVNTDKTVYVTASTANTAVDLSSGSAFVITIASNTTFSFTNPPGGTNITAFTIITVNDATPGRAIVWPASVTWAGGQTPSRTTTANKSDAYTFFTRDAGTQYVGSLAILNY